MDDEACKVRAVLEQIDESGELRSFAGPRHAKLALITFARGRGLIVWDRTCAHHALTPAGRRWLAANGGVVRPRRRKFPSRLIGATIGVTVMAGAWFSADASRQMFNPASRNATVSLAVPHAGAKLDPMAPRVETRQVDRPALGHPLTLIQADAPVFAAPRRMAAVADNAPQSAGGEPSRPLDQATKRAVHPGRKTSRVARHRDDDRGSAMALFEPDRPLRRATDYPDWGISEQNATR